MPNGEKNTGKHGPRGGGMCKPSEMRGISARPSEMGDGARGGFWVVVGCEFVYSIFQVNGVVRARILYLLVLESVRRCVYVFPNPVLFFSLILGCGGGVVHKCRLIPSLARMAPCCLATYGS